jgi:hypothetical protein
MSTTTPTTTDTAPALTAAARVRAALLAQDGMRSALFDRAAAFIQFRIPGWSQVTHYIFFKAILEALPEAKSMLVLGVFQGRDIAFIGDSLHRHHPDRDFQIVGVDRFADAPCTDWPKEMQGSWAEAGFGAPPSIHRATENLTAIDRHHGVTLWEEDDLNYLKTTQRRFDIVYLDTAHDYATVAKQLGLVARVCNPGALLCGDDYADTDTWGVKTACIERLRPHAVFAGNIWFADVSALRAEKA